MRSTLRFLPLLLALSTAASVAYGKNLVVCTEASPEGFDMVQYTTAVTADAASQTIFNRLVGFKPGTTEPVPELAESWDISADGLTYTFHLRRGVKFQSTDYFNPSRDFNADDVLFTFQRQLDPTHPWHASSKVGYPYFESMGFRELLEAVEKRDDHTVVFTLSRPEAPFLVDLAMAFTSIYSAEYADQLLKAGHPEQLNSKPIGTGPFILSRYTKDSQVRFKANPTYFLGKPPSDGLVFAITTDSNVRLQKLRANECQVALYPRPEDVPRLKADSNLKVAEIAAMVTAYVAINTSKPYLSDPRVREAINLAFDKGAYVDALYGHDNALAGIAPYPPTLLGFNPQLKNPPRDLAKARDLLKQAGVPEGTVFTLFTRNGGGVTNPNPLLGAQMLQADLAAIGIKLQIRVMEWAEMLKRAKSGEHDLVSAGWAGDNGDPDNFLTPMLSCEAAKNGENYARWCNPRFQALIDQARAKTEPAARAALYEQALALFAQDLPWLSRAHPKLFTVIRTNVEGYTISPLTYNNFATTRAE